MNFQSVNLLVSSKFENLRQIIHILNETSFVMIFVSNLGVDIFVEFLNQFKLISIKHKHYYHFCLCVNIKIAQLSKIKNYIYMNMTEPSK